MKTAVDSNVLIAAFRGDNAAHAAALAIIDDPIREFVVSAFVRLEVLPKTVYNTQYEEKEFYEAFFQNAAEVQVSHERFEASYQHAQQYGLSASDAIVTEAAIHARAEEFVTAESRNKPMFRIPDQVLRLTSIAAN